MLPPLSYSHFHLQMAYHLFIGQVLLFFLFFTTFVIHSSLQPSLSFLKKLSLPTRAYQTNVLLSPLIFFTEVVWRRNRLSLCTVCALSQALSRRLSLGSFSSLFFSFSFVGCISPSPCSFVNLYLFVSLSFLQS